MPQHTHTHTVHGYCITCMCTFLIQVNLWALAAAAAAVKERQRKGSSGRERGEKERKAVPEWMYERTKKKKSYCHRCVVPQYVTYHDVYKISHKMYHFYLLLP